jgi:hypothetical protein
LKDVFRLKSLAIRKTSTTSSSLESEKELKDVFRRKRQVNPLRNPGIREGIEREIVGEIDDLIIDEDLLESEKELKDLFGPPLINPPLILESEKELKVSKSPKTSGTTYASSLESEKELKVYPTDKTIPTLTNPGIREGIESISRLPSPQGRFDNWNPRRN